MNFCSWAGCREYATDVVGGWHFCAAHLALSKSLEDGLIDDLEDELKDAQEAVRAALDRVVVAREALARGYKDQGIKRRLPLLECGTHASFNRHLDNGEQPCVACVEGERIWQADAHRRRKQARVACSA